MKDREMRHLVKFASEVPMELLIAHELFMNDVSEREFVEAVSIDASLPDPTVTKVKNYLRDLRMGVRLGVSRESFDLMDNLGKVL